MNTAQIAKDRLVKIVKVDRTWRELDERLHAEMRREIARSFAIQSFIDKLSARTPSRG